jgi:phage-related protein
MMKEKNDKKGKKNQTKKQQRKQNKKAATSCIIMQPLLPLQSTRRILTYGGYFEAFMKTLALEQQQKVKYGLLLLKTQNRIPAKFVKHIEEGIYELRTEYEGNIFRTFFIFDSDNVVVLFNGFKKKTQQTPQNEIDKAKLIKKAYYEKICK